MAKQKSETDPDAESIRGLWSLSPVDMFPFPTNRFRRSVPRGSEAAFDLDAARKTFACGMASAFDLYGLTFRKNSGPLYSVGDALASDRTIVYHTLHTTFRGLAKAHGRTQPSAGATRAKSGTPAARGV
jgi:hypothetical protein